MQMKKMTVMTMKNKKEKKVRKRKRREIGKRKEVPIMFNMILESRIIRTSDC